MRHFVSSENLANSSTLLRARHLVENKRRQWKVSRICIKHETHAVGNGARFSRTVGWLEVRSLHVRACRCGGATALRERA